jgi:DNA recombination protein RmuC
METLLIVSIILSAGAVALTLIVITRIWRGLPMPPELATHIANVDHDIEALPAMLREEARISREDLRGALTAHGQMQETRLGALEIAIGTRFVDFGKAQNEQLDGMRKEAADGRAKLETSVRESSEAFANTQATKLGETNEVVRQLSDRLIRGMGEARAEQRLSLEGVTTKVEAMTEANAKKQDLLRDTIGAALEKLREGNEKKLDEMRATVDEKLQGTLEKRLGESFQLVSERLEQVHKGLGEMQTLATGVGDLKRVLSNVKSRGGWGEVQLGMLLEDMLTRDQYEINAKIRPETGETVEFAVLLPGRSDDAPLYLPIDAKFPHEDYDRLLVAQEGGVAEEIEKAAQAIERAIRIQAKVICDKYVHPPRSTDFAIMYLPTEGLFAEVIRRPGLANELQTKHRIMVTGPTTLAALLSSLQMGFRTLAIEKRSSEVWQVLSAAKAEFAKYGEVWDKLGKQLDTAKRTVDEAGRRTRAVTRSLKAVETLELPESPPVLEMVMGPEGGGESAAGAEPLE